MQIIYFYNYEKLIYKSETDGEDRVKSYEERYKFCGITYIWKKLYILSHFTNEDTYTNSICKMLEYYWLKFSSIYFIQKQARRNVIQRC